MSLHTWPNGSINIPTVTSEFGYRDAIPGVSASTNHQGIDLVWNPLDYNRASAPGVVSFAAYNGGGGNQVTVDHDDGTQTKYLHGAPGGYLVGVGDRVKRGQPLTIVGTTGNSTGRHCHFETRNYPGGPAINPRDFMAAHRTSTAGSGDYDPLDPELPKIGTSIMSLLPVALKIVNKDAAGNVTSAGLSGVYLTLGTDGGYVYPANEVGAITTVAAPYFNKTEAGPNGTILEISQENLHILLRDLCYQSPGTIVEQVAVSGGGRFLRDSVAADIQLTDEQVTQLAAAIKPVDLGPVVAAIAALDSQSDNYQAEVRALLARGLSGVVTLTPAAS